MHISDSDLRSFVSDFLLRGNAQSTADGYVAQLKKLRKHAERAVTIRSSKDFLAEVQHGSPWDAYMAARAIRSFVKWYANEYKAEDWSRSIDWCMPRDDKPQRTTSEADGLAILATCDDSFAGVRDRAVLAVLGTGLRRSELCRMDRDDIDWDTDILTVPKTKTNRSRQVHLPREVRRAVRKYESELWEWLLTHGRLEDGRPPWVWESISRRGRLNPDAVTKMVRKRSKAAGIDVTPQSYRRGFAVSWLRAGGSQAYLQVAAGWSSPRMVERYTRAMAQEESVEEARRIFG